MGKELSKGEEAKKGYDEDYDYENVGVSSCGWFGGICYSWRRGGGYVRHDQIQKEDNDGEEEGKEKKKWKKVKVLSEWTKSIRQKLRMNKKKRSMKVAQYDPKSYALNFDDGTHKEDGDDVYVDFSARYAHPHANLGTTINKGDSGCHVSEPSKGFDSIPRRRVIINDKNFESWNENTVFRSQ